MRNTENYQDPQNEGQGDLVLFANILTDFFENKKILYLLVVVGQDLDGLAGEVVLT